MSVFTSYDHLLLEGLMPQRALLRLKRAGIGIYDAKKIEKNQILFRVKRKDSEKVFAIYPDVCYNISVYRPFTVKKVGESGPARYYTLLKNRLGLVIGGGLFALLLLYFNLWTFSIEYVGTSVYARETAAFLEESGIKPFSVYKKGKEDWVCSKILSLDGVEFCSVKKQGLRVIVETRLSPFAQSSFDANDMVAKHTGTLLSMTVLRGTPLKKAGDETACGDVLVKNAFFKEDGGQVRVEPIARVSIGCVFDGVIEAKNEEEAFAKAYLSLDLSDGDFITERSVFGENGLYTVKIGYTVIETINFSALNSD